MAEGVLGSDIGQVPELVERFAAAEAARRGGADGIAAINTIKSVRGLNLHTYVSSPVVRG